MEKSLQKLEEVVDAGDTLQLVLFNKLLTSDLVRSFRENRISKTKIISKKDIA